MVGELLNGFHPDPFSSHLRGAQIASGRLRSAEAS